MAKVPAIREEAARGRVVAKVKPHAKIHVSVAHHPKTQDIWADPTKRGMLVEIWRLAMERFAGKRGDTLSLRPLDRQSISGIGEQSEADREILVLLRSLKYRVRKHPNRWDVHIRNFAKKHGFVATESTPDKRANRIPKKEEKRKKREEKRTGTDGTELPKGYETGKRLAPLLKLTAKSTEPERTLWLESFWPQIVATAESDHATKGGELAQHVRSYAISKWVFYLKERDPSKRQFAREAQAQESAAALAASKAAEAADLARDPPADDDPLADLLPFPATQTQDTAS